MTSDASFSSTSSARRMVAGRLAYWGRPADPSYWDDVWKERITRYAYQWAERGELPWIEWAVETYLPQSGRVLEAGCGLGQYVLALLRRGFRAEGVEWARETVEAVKALYPDLPIRHGDVMNLDVPEGTYTGYISLGVVEHRRDGPEPFLREAFRVLSEDGRALVSVPYMNVARRVKAALGMYRGRAEGLSFYQYAFTSREFQQILSNCGFSVIDEAPYDGLKGLRDELPLLRWLLRQRGIGWRLRRFLQGSPIADRLFGHMILFVCQKT